MCGQRILGSECSKICSGKHPVDSRCDRHFGVQQHRAARTGTFKKEFLTIFGIQGASTLSSITGQLAKGGDMAKTLDMKGREAAVELIEVGAYTFLLKGILNCFS